MNMKIGRATLILSVVMGLLFPWTAGFSITSALAEAEEVADTSTVVYADSLVEGWRDFSWGTIALENPSPVHGGSSSIKVDLEGYTGVYLYYPGFFPDGYNFIRFFIHGGATGGQQLNLYLKFNDNGTYVEGTRFRIPAPSANQWHEVLVPFSSLGTNDLPITGIIIQDVSGSTLPTFYIDDIALISDAHPDAPTITDPWVNPRAVQADGQTTVVVTAQISDPQGVGDIAEAFVDASQFGRGNVPLVDDGLHFDGSAGDGRYGSLFTVAASTLPGEYVVAIHALDAASNLAIVQAGALAVLVQSGGSVPSGLPTRLSLGTNAWTGTAGYDWNAASGVPWDYNYTYITYDWYTGGYGADYVLNFVTQAWDRGEVPVVVVYIMHGLAGCGESGDCYASALQDAGKVSTYLAALEQAVQEAEGSQPVVFNIEPDFIGFMQQYTISDTRPAGVEPDDPSSVPVALNRTGYEDNLVGFGNAIVDLIHNTAANALAAPMISWWGGDGDDPFKTIPEQVINNARRIGDFALVMGADKADLLMVEWGDRDAGSGLTPFWDTSHQSLPRASRANLWKSALSSHTGKRLLLWQMPAGNMGLDNSPQHYQDNRAEYTFSHLREQVDSGVFGIMFGGGNDEMTQVWTDGDAIRDLAVTAYAAPDAPGGLSVSSVTGAWVTLRWNPNSEPDVWGYIVEYSQVGGGAPVSVNVGRVNSFPLLIPEAGDYNVSVLAYDAMENQGAFSDSVSFTTTQDAPSVYLPLVFSGHQ
jgi:hypothetical protein